MSVNHVYLNLGGGRLYQFSNKSHVQMMSYLIESPDGRLVMIDGGNCCDEDADFLESVLREKGEHVSAWFLTHAHDDHYGTLLRLLEREKLKLTIDGIYFSFPSPDWSAIARENQQQHFVDFWELLPKSGLPTVRIGRGDCFDFGVSIEVLNSLPDYENMPSVNDTSIVLRVGFPKRDVLFLADLAPEGQKILVNESRDKLRCDIVQMAHHGQKGVTFDMYSLIEPKICLYPTPDWLWENDNGGGRDSGPWRTLQTREWMEQLHVQASFPAAFGDYVFE